MDSRTNIFLAAAAALLLLLLGVPAKRAQPSPPSVEPAVLSGPVAGASAAAIVRVGTAQELSRLAEHAAGLNWGRDPFGRPIEPEPEATPEPEPPALEPAPTAPEPEPRPPLPQVTGVGLGARGSYAIVDRRVVQIGDSLPDGFEVLRIERGVVTVGFRGEEIPLILGD